MRLFVAKKVIFAHKKTGMGLATEDCRDVWGVSWCEFLKLSSLSKVTSVTNSLNHKSHQVVIIVLIVMVLVLSLSSCWSHQLSLPLRSIVRKVKSVLGTSEVPDGYLGLGYLLSCHCWQAPNTYWHRSPCLCQNNEKPFSKRITGAASARPRHPFSSKSAIGRK